MGFLKKEDFDKFINQINNIEQMESSISILNEEISKTQQEISVNKDFSKNFIDKLADLSSKVNDLNSLKEEKNILFKNIDNNKHNLGEEIRNNFSLILSETDDFVKNTLPGGRSIENIKKTVSSIEEFLAEIKIYTNYLEKINYSSSVNIIQQSQNIIVQNHQTQTTQSKTSFYPIEEYILDSQLDFGEFSLNSKTGYSLKSFFQLHTEKVKTVMNYFNFNKELSIKYFQKYHGLCNGESISPNTWNSLCSTINCNEIKKSSLELTLNGHKIDNSNCHSDYETLCLLIEKIGCSFLLKHFTYVFDSRFTVSTYPIKMNYGFKTELIQDKKYYIHLHLSNNAKKKFLDNFKNKLKRHNMMIDYSFT